MEELFRIAAIALIGALLALLLRRHVPELGLLLALLVALLIASSALRQTGLLADTFRSLRDASGLPSDVFLPLLKTVGIGIVTRIAAALCRDAHESAIASTVELAGTVAALCTALPLITLVLRTVTSLL